MEEYMKKFFKENNIDYIEVDGHVFTASGDKTAKEVYEKWLENQNKIDICPAKTVEEQVTEIQKQIALLQTQVSDLVLSDLMKDEEE